MGCGEAKHEWGAWRVIASMVIPCLALFATPTQRPGLLVHASPQRMLATPHLRSVP